jgi:hypothetical protein
VNAKKKKLKDQNGVFIIPITHTDAVIDETGKTLTTKLQEIGSGGGTEHTHTIDDIEDINATNKTNGNVLTFDSDLGEMVLKPLPAGTGSGATNLDGLADVDVTTSLPTEGDALSYIGGIWKPNRLGNKANAEIPLYIETFAGGKNMPIHCKIVKFDTAWNGYKYWMAYTPWPDDVNENPSIAVSNDLLYWETPIGLTNPIAVRNPAWTNFDYYSDTDLIYNPDTGKLECWYRWNSTSGNQEKIHRKTSSDGITWSPEETLRENVGSLVQMVAPSVIYENSKYRIWVGYERSVIKYYESTDGYNWQFISNVSGTLDWHFKMERTDKGIEYLGGGSSDISHALSADGITFTGRKSIIKPGNRGNFDDKTLYLACMVKIGLKYYVYYTGRNTSESLRGLGLTISTIDNDITSLRGMTAGGYTQMAKPRTSGATNQRPTNTSQIGTFYFDTQIGKPIWKKTTTTWCDANGATV